MSGDKERIASEIGKLIGDRCQGRRKPGQAPTRYAYISQGARLGALEALSRAHSGDGEEVARLRAELERYADQLCEGWCDKDPKACASIGEENCGGCRARSALALRGGKSG